MRSLQTAGQVSRMAADLGLNRQTLILNRASAGQAANLPALENLPERRVALPVIEQLSEKQLHSASVLDLDQEAQGKLDAFMKNLFASLSSSTIR